MALHAGIARSLINPPLDIPSGLWMAQKHVRAEGLDTDLTVTALALRDGPLRAVLLDFDICFFSDAQAAAIRQAVASATGVPASHVFPFCSHTHAGPVTMECYQGEGEDCVRAYAGSLPFLAAGAARQACAILQPVRVRGAAGRSDIGINRNVELPDGQIIVGCNPDGLADRSVPVLRIDSLDGSPLACVLNYTAHPTVLGPGNRLLSPDYPGHARAAVERNTDAMCFFLQGAAGDMGPVETFVPDVEIARNLGTRLGLEAARVFLGIRTQPGSVRLKDVIASGGALADYEFVPADEPPQRLAVAVSQVDLPVRDPQSDVYEHAPEMLARAELELQSLQKAGAAAAETALALQRVVRLRLRAGRMARFRGRKTLPLETVAIRMGDAAIVAICGEPFCKAGIEIKESSPFPGQTLVAGYLGGDMMYIADSASYDHPHASMQLDNCPYTREASGIATEHLKDLLRRV